jgi:hypothetical protein
LRVDPIGPVLERALPLVGLVVPDQAGGPREPVPRDEQHVVVLQVGIKGVAQIGGAPARLRVQAGAKSRQLGIHRSLVELRDVPLRGPRLEVVVLRAESRALAGRPAQVGPLGERRHDAVALPPEPAGDPRIDGLELGGRQHPLGAPHGERRQRRGAPRRLEPQTEVVQAAVEVGVPVGGGAFGRHEARVAGVILGGTSRVE